MVQLKEIWKNKALIWEGFINKLFRKRYVERIAAERQEICNYCDYLDEKGDDCFISGTQPCCSECGCSLSMKTRSLASSCPLGYWDAVEPEEEETE